MEIDILRRRLVNSSANISRALSAYLSVSSISYVKRMEVQNNNPSQADQVNKFNKSQGLYLFYTNSKIRKDNTLLKYVLCLLTSLFPPHHHFLLILHFICCYSISLLFFLQSLQSYPTYLYYYVNRYILKQSVFILQLDYTRASFFSPSPRYVLSESCYSIYLVSFPLVLVTLKYICLFISNHCISISLGYRPQQCLCLRFFLRNSLFP